ncbi:MAG: hypothetical protein H0Z24_03075 [Thermosipho sp. (in: Bacteria)]|nr:hypothetical protein [Thermosipho sp. (in: thermotogales)]
MILWEKLAEKAGDLLEIAGYPEEMQAEVYDLDIVDLLYLIRELNMQINEPEYTGTLVQLSFNFGAA